MRNIPIEEFTYHLPEERIAKYPLQNRHDSKLLVYKNNTITSAKFSSISEQFERNDLIIFNNTKVIQARIIFFKESGARIEIFCLEPHLPSHYESAFSVVEKCQWKVLVGGRKKWKEGKLTIHFEHESKSIALSVEQIELLGRESIVEFTWNDSTLSFGEILHILGKIPIPPYLCRESEQSDLTTYQTLYSKFEGSVAAPTAGLHFTNEVFESLKMRGVDMREVTLHVGAGTFLPVKSSNAAEHNMHIEHFDVNISDLEVVAQKAGSVIAVGTTSVRTLESLSVLGYRAYKNGDINQDLPVQQWEAYDIPHSISGKELLEALIASMKESGIERLFSSTAIMITPGYKFRVVKKIVTNFHQPQSTLLLLISAAVGDSWREIYKYALQNEYRFLSYGDSSVLEIK
ncbi:MAG: S-adenosylmethionine:tRNA ribosyltransferase-isomerase [Rikenellaceae bacterium]